MLDNAAGIKKTTAPVSAIVATKDRPAMVQRTLEQIALQSCIPVEVIFIDASGTTATRDVCESFVTADFKIVYKKAIQPGAALQRMQGVDVALQPIIWFLDDDVIMEAECTLR